MRSQVFLLAFVLYFRCAYSISQHQVEDGQARTSSPRTSPGNPVGNRQRYSNILTGPLTLDRGPIYINPNLSTKSLTAERKHSSSSPVLPVVSSSIGKNEQTQLSEWPFVRSLQMARQSHMLQQQHPFQGLVDRFEQPSSSPQPPDYAKTTVASEVEHAEIIATSPQAQTEDTTFPTSTDDSTTTQSSTRPTEEDLKAELLSSSTTSSPSETSPIPMSTSEPDIAPETTNSSSSDGNLFARDFHSSIQKAVDRLIKIGADGIKNKSQSGVQNEPLKDNSQRSSLSLNVLLKNFGVYNLTNMDQILLKSTLRNDSTTLLGRPSRLNESSNSDQSLEINGARTVNSASSQPTSMDPSEDSDDQIAECKIEYTMKHVNISLMNGGHGDYTCDYVIDRKLATSNNPNLAQRQHNKWLDTGSATKVCKLQISSQYFSNSSESRESPCNGTYLSIANQNFCYFKQTGGLPARTQLNRIFDFPIESNAFDIKMVHKRARSLQATVESNEAEIHLEIKPLLDNTCSRQTNTARAPFAPNQTTSSTTTATTSTTSTTTTTSTTRAPRTREKIPISPVETVTPSSLNSSSVLEPRDLRATNNLVTISVSPKQKFILKLPHDKQLHPMNNQRFKVSQTFDVTSTPKLNPQDQWQLQARSEVPPKLCDSGLQSSSLGQITSPDYPLFYQAGIDCSFIIHKTSKRFCQLQLHFRDFDLLQAATASEDTELCLGDYLQIGKTRYCNKYAMIGHRMRLDFPTSDAIELRFHSDSMQGGRGFLIKYQQIECNLLSDEPKPAAVGTSGQQVSAPVEQVTLHARTIAPPQQQPDFELALKTTSGPPKVPSESPKAFRKLEPAAKLAKSAKDSQHSDQMKFKETTQSIGQVSTTPKTSGTNSSSTSTLMPMASTVSVNSALFQSVEHPNRDSTLNSIRQSALDCNQLHSSREFFMSSPNYPNQYAENLQCLHYIRRNNSRVCYLELTFIKFDLEADADCRFDSLEVNNVRLCGLLKDTNGLKTTRIYLFEEPIKMIKFKTDSSNSKDGFLIRAEQLECALDGSIQRASSLIENRQDPNRTVQQTNVSSRESNQSREISSFRTTIHYDSTSAKKPITSPSGAPTRNSAAWRFNNDQSEHNCDELFFGSEVTIKSPHWPESYGDDNNLNTCRYTILRDISSRHKICQLELRFVNLRLGVADCIDVNGFEVLCGFNTRNMIKHYPFEKQAQLTISFLSGAARSGRSSQSGSSAVDLLPGRQPLRFMIIAKQHECIDGFLAPQERLNSSSLTYSSPENSHPRTVVRNNPSHLDSTTLIADKSPVIRYDFDSFKAHSSHNRTSPKSTLMYSMLNAINIQPTGQPNNMSKLEPTSATKPISSCVDGSILRTSEQLYTSNYPLGYLDNSHCRLLIERQDASMCYLELEFVDLDLESDQSSCQNDYIQIRSGANSLERFCNMAQIEKRLGSKQSLLVAFEPELEYKVGLLFHSNHAKSGRGFLLLHRQLPCNSDLPEKKVQVGPRSGSEQKQMAAGSQVANQRCKVQYSQYNGIISTSSLSPRSRSIAPQVEENICEVSVKLLPGFCQLQLSFGEFELGPRIGGRCALDWLELTAKGEPAARRYCAGELKNSTILLDQTDATMRVVQLDYLASPSLTQGFRAIFKQIECVPEPLPASLGPANKSVPTTNQQRETSEARQSSMPKVDFRELAISGEFFELDSSKLSSTKLKDQYDPNLFVVYRIRRFAPEVCKLRLMLYRFDLEMSANCKRDFLDVNNLDRLCGQLNLPEQTRRDYDWPNRTNTSDFLVSFVSDSLIQRRGFLIFGQQIRSNCSPGGPVSTSASFDEEPNQHSTPASKPEEAQSLLKDSQGPQVDKQASGNCYKLIDAQTFELSSPGWPQRYAPGQICYYLIHKAHADICSLTLNVNSMVLGPQADLECQPDSMDHLDIDEGSRVLCGLTTKSMEIEIDFKSKQFLTVKFNGSQGTGFGFLIAAKQNKCSSRAQNGSEPETILSNQDVRLSELEGKSSSCNRLITEKVSLIESSHFPEPYEHNQDCIYVVRRLNQSICAVDLTLNHFDLEEGHLNVSSSASAMPNCDSDYMEIDYSRFCGLYPPKHKLRFNYFTAELDKMIRFRSDAALSRSGFSILVSQVSECNASEVNHLPEQKSSAEGAPTGDEIISYLPDSSTAANSTSKPAAMIIQEQQQDSLEPNTLCEFTYRSERQNLVSPGYQEKRNHYDNNLDCLYKIHARGYQFCALSLSILDLDLEKSSECHNDYLLIDNRRYCGHLDSSGNVTRLELAFPETLPREVHLRLHTNAYVNQGRGFKLQYEQLPCLSPSSTGNDKAVIELEATKLDNREPASYGKSSGQLERQLRRSHLGQLSYPENYVSEQRGQPTASDQAIVESTTHAPRASKSAQDLWSYQIDQVRLTPKRELNGEKPRNQPAPGLAAAAAAAAADQDLFLRREINVVKPPVPHLGSMRS